jgi:hypothetical protein
VMLCSLALERELGLVARYFARHPSIGLDI